MTYAELHDYTNVLDNAYILCLDYDILDTIYELAGFDEDDCDDAHDPLDNTICLLAVTAESHMHKMGVR